MKAFRSLTQEEAALRPAVVLTAVVTYFRPEHYRLYIQDKGEATYAERDPSGDPNGRPLLFHRGDRVEFTGHAERGGLSPILRFSSYRILSRNAMPQPEKLMFPDLDQGWNECHWVQIHGHVISASINTKFADGFNSGGLDLVIASGRDRVNLTSDEFDPAPGVKVDVRKLLDSDVKVNGVVAHIAKRGQFLGSLLFVSDLRDIAIESKRSSDPFAIPLQPIGSLLTWSPGHRTRGRTRIAGTVTLFQPGQSLYLQDETQGIAIETSDKLKLRPGDRAEAIGFAVPGEYSPFFRDASVMKLSEGKPIAPTHLESPGAAPTGSFNEDPELARWLRKDGDLVEIDAELIDERLSSHPPTLLLSAGALIFSAEIVGPEHGRLHFERGSKVRLTGICRVAAEGFQHGAASVRLLVEPHGIRLLSSPPWSTGVRLLRILLIVGLALAMVAAWALSLRRQVNKQTKLLRSRATRDGLTDLWNRTEILSILDRELAEARRNQGSLEVVLVDLDHFKAINDNYGHQVGDYVLAEAARRLKAMIHPRESIGRYGGEEILIVLPGESGGPNHRGLDQLRSALANEPMRVQGLDLRVTCSLGACWSSGAGESSSDLIRLADSALYGAKRNGRNCVVALSAHNEIETRKSTFLNETGCSLAAQL